MVRPTSWRDVPAVRGVTGARYTPGGLGSWRSVSRDLRPVSSTRSRTSGRGGGRGQANDLERQIAERAVDRKGDGFSITNAGGDAILKALDALDTPGAFVRSGINQAANTIYGGDSASFDDFVEGGWRNISGSEVLYGSEEEANRREPGFEVPVLGRIGTGFALDVATDPLTYVTGGAAKVGTRAGEQAARKLLSPSVQRELGEQAVRAAERTGNAKYTDRAAAVAEQGKTIALTEAQKALKYKSNQMLSPQAREAIGAIPGTFMKIPGQKRLKIDKLIEKVAPSRVVDSTRPGRKAFKLTGRELGAGRLGGRLRAKVTQSGPANRVAQLFTKYPDLREKMLFGTPEEAFTGFMGLQSRTAGNLQTRLREQQWGGEMAELLEKAKRAGVDGEDLYFATAERLGGASAMGEASQRVVAALSKVDGGDEVLERLQGFWDSSLGKFNEIDPDLPVLMHRDGYVPRRPSESAIARRGGRGNQGSSLRKDSFDYPRTIGVKTPDRPDMVDELFGTRIVDPAAHPKRWTEDKQIKQIIEEAGLPNYFETDAYKAFPDQVRAMSRRYGDEFMAKRLRDLGIADPLFVRELTEAGHKQGRINAAAYGVLTRARIRADRAQVQARAAERDAAGAVPEVRRGRELVDRASQGRADVQADRDNLAAMADALDPEPLREFAVELQEDAATLAVKRQALLDNIGAAEDVVFGLEHAVVEQGHRLARETYSAYSRVTRLESRLASMYDELGTNYERMRLMAGGTDYSAARRNVDDQLVKARERAEKIIANESRFKAGAFDEINDRINMLENLKRDPQALKAWADRQKNLGRFESELMISEAARKEMVDIEADIADTMARIHDIEVLLHDFEDVAALPTDHLHQQVAEVDQMLADLNAAYAAGDETLAPRIGALANARASAMHEIGAIERARARLAEADQAAPQLLEDLNSMFDQQALGDRIVHAQFPDLPAEVSGARVREFFADRHSALLDEIDATNGQVMSAYADRDTMRAELSEIKTNKRRAEANLRKVSQEITAKERALWENEQELLGQADVALTRALEIDDELEMAKAQLGEFNDQLEDSRMAESMAEHYLAVMKARQLKYEAKAITAEATAAEARKTEKLWEKITQAQFNKEQETALQLALKDNFKQIGAVSQTQHDWLVEGLKAQTIMAGPEGLRPMLRAFDRVQTLWKAYALSTPGTVLRNLSGGVYNNYLADVGIRSGDYDKVIGVVFGKGNRLSAADKAIFQEIQDSGLMTASATVLEMERTMGASVFNPGSVDFKPLRWFRGRQEQAENIVRGALAYRTIANGGTTDDAIANVMKYHFDYDDISAFERSAMRRVVPFYTWTRKNLPLMVQEAFQKPTAFSRFYQLKLEIEAQSEEQGLVPEYFHENLAIRMPFHLQGRPGYMLPDLPFMTVNDVTDPTTAFSQMSPFVKAPIEYAFGKQFFKGIPLRDEYEPVPRVMSAIPPLMGGLGAIGLAERGPNGTWYMKHKDMKTAEAMLPVFGRTRRLFPSEDKFESRVWSSWLSTMGGLGLRTLTDQEQRNAAYARVEADLNRYDRHEQLGYFDDDTKMPRRGQTINAAYEYLGVPKDEDDGN